MTEDEFLDMVAYLNWRGEQAERARQGLPLDDGRVDDADAIHRKLLSLSKHIKATQQ